LSSREQHSGFALFCFRLELMFAEDSVEWHEMMAGLFW
jgi:hypothetical protein